VSAEMMIRSSAAASDMTLESVALAASRSRMCTASCSDVVRSLASRGGRFSSTRNLTPALGAGKRARWRLRPRTPAPA
jgi:hypothetical protein